MFRKQPSKPQNRIDSLIGVGTKIEGNINFTEAFVSTARSLET